MEHGIILVPLDASTTAEGALPYAETLARATGASLTLLSVVEPRALPLGGVAAPALAGLDEEQRRSRAAYLEQVAMRLHGRGLHVATAIAEGSPADEIITAADDAEAVLVVITARGQGGARAPGPGATADRVLRLSHRPVLVVPATAQGDGATIRIRHLMVPLDGSTAAESAFCPAVELAHVLGARLALVRAQPWLSPVAVPYSRVPGLTRQDEHAGEIAERYLEQVQERGPTEVRREAFVLRGAPREELLRFAREERVDLIVMTSHGRGGMARRLLGSTAEHMLHAGLPVLLVRPLPLPVPGEGVPRSEVQRCAGCGRPITFEVSDDTVCPRCRAHLHSCANCVLWDGTGCLLRRPESHGPHFAGRGCPYFQFRSSREPRGAGEAARTRNA